jgi:outer membrane receptor protein involved in Fe transport
MQLRAAYSQTVNRPDIREMSASSWIDPVDRYTYTGNPNLDVAQINNYDLAWQWYYTDEDSVEIGSFFKDFTDPIEVILLNEGARRDARTRIPKARFSTASKSRSVRAWRRSAIGRGGSTTR